MQSASSAMPPSLTNALEMKEIVKEFTGVRALNRVSFSVRKGEIHSLCGENGAGKSTLMKILSGVYPHPSYGGEIVVEGRRQEFQNTRASENAGIAIIHQELSLVKEMTVGENIFIGHEPTRFGIIDWDKVYSRTHELLKSIGLDVNPRQKIKYLGIGQQQLVEIAKALNQNPKILVLDEPTSALTESEVRTLLAILKKLRDQGVSCIMISHKLNEVFEISDRITVLRDGQSVSTYEAKEVTEAKIISDMVGRELKDLYPKGTRSFGETVLEVKDLTVDHPSIPGRKVLTKVSFRVKAGEVVGIAGLMGAGRSELLMTLFGAYAGKSRGEVRLHGKRVHIKSPHDAIVQGMSLLTEDRKRYGLVLDQSVLKNITLAGLNRLAPLGVVDVNQEVTVGKRYAKELRVKAPSLDAPVATLSGGNQQKVVLAKCLMTEPEVLFLDEPTRGIDVGARAEIYQLMNDLAAKGLAIVMISSELPEVLGMSDRVLVMSEGHLTADFTAAEATQEKIMAAATAAKKSGA